MSNTPSDAELDALRQADNGALNFVTLRQFRTVARAVLEKWGTPAPVEPVAVVVPCYTPSGKRVALCSAKQDLPIGTQLYTAPQPSPAAQGDALDAERLDWLDADESRCVFHLGKSWYTRPSYGLPYRKRASLRAAIDAARAVQEDKSHDN